MKAIKIKKFEDVVHAGRSLDQVWQGARGLSDSANAR
jgi:hypothetical protein